MSITSVLMMRTPMSSFAVSGVVLPKHRSVVMPPTPPPPPRRSATLAFGPARKTRIHRLVESEGAVLMPGCYDALSASIVQIVGFSGAFISGYALSASLLGKPDFGLLRAPEMSNQVMLVCSAASNIPIIADADTGGGNALNVQRIVRELISSGAAGCFLEDQAWPKKCDEYAAKIASARNAIGNADFFLVARTDACSRSAKTGLAEAIFRANLYMEAGADACSLKLARRQKGLRVCSMLEGGVTPLHARQELKAMGFHLIVHPLTSLYASAHAMMDILRFLKEAESTRTQVHKAATFEEFNKLIGLEKWFELEARFSKFTN